MSRTEVAQTSGLLYRRLPACRRRASSRAPTLRASADCKSAIRQTRGPALLYPAQAGSWSPSFPSAVALNLRGISCICALLFTFAPCSGFSQEWHQGPGYRFQPLTVPANGKAGFTLLPPQQTGIWFTNSLPESRSLTNTILPNGSGVAAGDIDGDGRCDLFFSGLAGASRLYRNLGNWKFEDITARSGVVCSNLDATGAVFADIDGDGDLDLLVSSIGGGVHIFINDGKGHFTPSPQVLNPGRGGTSLALADTDGHGKLDLYIANYRASTIMDAPGTRFSMRMVNGKPEVATINGRPLTDPEWTNRFTFKTGMDAQGRGRFAREELGEPDVFCRNDGHGHFEPVSWTSGTFLDEEGRPLSGPPFDWGLSVMFRDFNGDGAPDLYICDDFNSPDRFWLNDGKGHFRAAPSQSLRETSFSSMGIDVADLNRDGHDDFLVVDMLSPNHRRHLTQRNSAHSEMAPDETTTRPQYPRNTLFLNRGDGTYAEIAQYAGLDATEWSWSPIFLDVDLDGYEDLLIPNGFIRDNMNLDVQNRIKQATAGSKIPSAEALSLRRLFPSLATANLAFRNRGDLRFEDVSSQWGFNTAAISQGACLADLDDDGDLDVVVNNMNEVAGLYRNDVAAPRVAVRLNGLPPNTRGIGSRISVTGGPVPQSQVMVCGGRYLSADDALRVFAAGTLTNKLRIDVTWRSGKHSVVVEALPNYLYEIAEAGAQAPSSSPPPEPSPVFQDVSERLGHTHHDEPFDDFQRQPLLPKRLSQLGPGVCWWDIDGDGWDDLIIASGKGGPLACYRNDGRGGFSQVNQLPWTTMASRDQTAIVGWQSGAVLVGTATYEDAIPGGTAVQICQWGQTEARDVVTAWDSSVGPLAVADYDGDGSLDLFVGGRVKPGQYPLAATSQLLRQLGGKLVLDETNSALLRDIGMVSGAVWSDLDGDGFPELILACEWGPLKIFHNDHGHLIPWNPPVTVPTAEHPLNSPPSTLNQLIGWWNGVSVADLDGDGRLDIVAANWGRNSRYERHRQRPLRIYYGDFTQDGNVGLLESYFEPTLGKYAPSCSLDRAARGVPFLAARYATHQAWAETSIDDALQEAAGRVHFLEATWLESTVFLNRGDHFEARVLPPEAQFAPAFATCVADYDGNGTEDIFLSQNFFDVDSATSRYDAGRGLWLQGDGHGGFRAIPGQESGVRVYGEQRGAAICDFDGDGRADLVVTQNRGETKLFRNTKAKPGLRVQLEGPVGNPRGVGAVLRLKFNDHFGPAREIHAGSGYWSQDSVVQVMATPEPATALWVRWPGGQTNLFQVPAGAREVRVSQATLRTPAH